MDLTGTDFGRPNAARMYDYLLGGRHNFAVDRALADEAVRCSPGLRTAVWAFRDFLRRTVQQHCIAAGIDQFLDLGSGVPTVGNVHEVALRLEPHARIAYVDHESVAVDDVDDPELAARVRAGQRVYARSTHPTVLRSRAELMSWFGDLDLVAPGLVGIVHWRPDTAAALPDRIGAYGGFGIVLPGHPSIGCRTRSPG